MKAVLKLFVLLFLSASFASAQDAGPTSSPGDSTCRNGHWVDDTTRPIYKKECKTEWVKVCYGSAGCRWEPKTTCIKKLVGYHKKWVCDGSKPEGPTSGGPTTGGTGGSDCINGHWEDDTSRPKYKKVCKTTSVKVCRGRFFRRCRWKTKTTCKMVQNGYHKKWVCDQTKPEQPETGGPTTEGPTTEGPTTGGPTTGGPTTGGPSDGSCCVRYTFTNGNNGCNCLSSNGIRLTGPEGVLEREGGQCRFIPAGSHVSGEIVSASTCRSHSANSGLRSLVEAPAQSEYAAVCDGHVSSYNKQSSKIDRLLADEKLVGKETKRMKGSQRRQGKIESQMIDSGCLE